MKSLLLVLLLNTFTLYAFPSPMEVKKKLSLSGICITKGNDASIEKERTYCSPSYKTKYKLLINNDKIRITRLYNQYKEVVTGVIKKGKIYSNNPNEKEVKSVWGNYYKLEKNNFGVLNIENGDYEWFSECKG